MKLIDPLVSRAMASMMKNLSPKDKFVLSDLTLEFTELSQLPKKWQIAIEAEMAKNAVLKKSRN